MHKICGYFKLQIYTHFGVKIERYRGTEAHMYDIDAPDVVPYPIEPTRYVLGRVTTAFQIGAFERYIETTWWQVRRRRHLQ